jgi:hypothetical protein
MNRRFIISALAILVLLAIPAFADETDVSSEIAFDFESGPQGWLSGANLDAGSRVTASLESGQAAVLSFVNSDSATLCLRRELDLSGFRALRFRVRLPSASAAMHVAVFLVGARDTWYQTWRPIRLERGVWQQVEIDLRAATGALAPAGHAKPWGPYPAQRVSELGIQVFADRPLNVEALVDDVEFVPRDAAPPEMTIYNYELSSRRAGLFEKFEITFESSRFWENPYDPSQVEVLGEFTAPDGTTTVVPGFYYQGYERSLDEAMEVLVPVGPPKWKVRYAPRLTGEYRFRVIVRDGTAGDSFEVPADTFESVASDDPGCPRVSSDPRYFEFQDGSFFYPIGHSIPATFDVKGEEMLGVTGNPFEGTFAYDRYLKGMASAGENFGRIWLGSWSFGLEWSPSYHPAYEGIGRYNQENAWRLDYVLDKAESLEIWLQIALTTFGHWATTDKEGDWSASPYNKANGGPLDAPKDFWSDGPSQEIYQRMVRYVMARWGYSSHVASWELSNEVDLVTGYKSAAEQIRDWHVRCAETIRRFDPNPHMITTNFANFAREAMILSLSQISYTGTNHYRINIVDEMRKRVFPMKAELGKPAMMTECGQDFRPSSPESTTSYLHICLWSSYMIPFAGSGMPWWWDFIDDRNLYSMFTPFVDFAEGEDRRNRGLNTADEAVRGPDDQPIGELPALALRNDHSGYFWIYEQRLQRSEADELFVPAPRAGLDLQLTGLRDGPYRVEFWDTWRGGVVSQLTAEAKGGTLRVPIPEFTSDIAGKFRGLETAEAEEGPSSEEEQP